MTAVGDFMSALDFIARSPPPSPTPSHTVMFLFVIFVILFV